MKSSKKLVFTKETLRAWQAEPREFGDTDTCSSGPYSGCAGGCPFCTHGCPNANTVTCLSATEA